MDDKSRVNGDSGLSLEGRELPRVCPLYGVRTLARAQILHQLPPTPLCEASAGPAEFPDLLKEGRREGSSVEQGRLRLLQSPGACTAG